MKDVLKKFWEWMFENFEVEYNIIKSVGIDLGLRSMNQMLIGYKIEYLKSIDCDVYCFPLSNHWTIEQLDVQLNSSIQRVENELH